MTDLLHRIVEQLIGLECSSSFPDVLKSFRARKQASLIRKEGSRIDPLRREAKGIPKRR
jgi:hypothetical protein